MAKRESISRYNLIIKKVRKQPSTLKEIAHYLSIESEIQAYNFNVSDRTLKRDISEIRSIYNIDIEYNFSTKVYSINPDQHSEINERILEAFDTFNALNISDRLSDYIHFEKRKPQGTENLYGLLHAIQKRVQITFSHQKYWEEEKTERIAEPYAIKEFKNRWYVMANDLKDNCIKSFALDRISNFEITKKKFQYPKDFNINEHFKNCFGIISPQNFKLQKIVLSFDPYQGKYIKSLPLHESQEILKDNENELLIQLSLYVTLDFLMEILSYGNTVKVIKPKSLQNEIIGNLKLNLAQYDSK